MINKQDRRVERTKRDFKNSLFQLMEEKKNINLITVSEIAEKANYNRATFYVHYSDKESLLNDITEESINGFIEAFRDPYNEMQILDFQQLSINVIQIFNYVEMNAERFSLLFNDLIFPGFQHKLSYAIEEVFINELHFLDDTFKKINADIFFRAKAYSIIAMIDFWIEQDFMFSSKYMTKQLIKIENYFPNKVRTFNKTQ